MPSLPMRPFLSSLPTRARVLSTLLLAASSAACGGVAGTDQLFGSGGAGTTSGAAGSGAGTTTSGTTTSGTTTSGTTTTGTTTSGTTTSGMGGCQTGFTCVDADPPGWTGHYYVSEVQLPAPAPPACPAGLTARTDHASPAGAAQCTACSCGNLQGAACSPPALTCWINSTTCNGGQSIDLTQFYQDGACHSTAVTGGGGVPFSCKLTSAPMVIAPGGCAPSTSDFPNKVSWQQRVDACGADQASGACGTGKVCVPQGPGAAGESLCIRSDGMAACPAGWPKAIVAYANATDTRACSGCACGGPGTTCGDAHYTFYTQPQCVAAGTTGVAQVNSSNCTDLTPEVTQNMGSAKATLPVAKGSCAASGGTATGSVTPQNPVTYCCK